MANEEHLKILKKGITVWNPWRERKPEIVPDFSGADLRGMQLANVNLSKADLSGARLQRTNLNGANLARANLKNVSARWCTFTGAKLIRVVASAAQFPEANFQQADLTGGDFAESNFKGSHLSNVLATKTNLRGCDFTKATLMNANLTEARLSDAYLKEVSLGGAILKYTDLNHAIAENVQLAGADLSYANVRQVNFFNANFTNATLRGVDFTETDIENANFMKAIADEEGFREGQLSETQRTQLDFEKPASGGGKPPSEPPVATETPDEPEEKDIKAILNEAHKALRNSVFDRAIELCNKVLSISPNHTRAMGIRRISYSRLGRYDEVIKELDIILKREPNNIRALEDKGLALFNKKDYDAAYDTFKLYVKLDSGSIVAWHSMGEILFHRDSFAEAIKCLDKAIEINPHNESSWVVKARALSNSGKYESAINCLNEALEYSSDKNNILVEKENIEKEMLDKDAGKQEDAKKQIIKLHEDIATFLIKEKGWHEVYYDNENYKDMGIDLSLKHPLSRDLIAIFTLTTNIDRKIESRIKASFAQSADLEIGKFLITPSSQKSAYSFMMYKYSDRGLVRIQPEDFPAYEGPNIPDKKLSIADFNRELTDIGKELLDKLIELIKSDSSLVIEVKKPTYINIEIKKPVRVALQIHRVADNNDNSQLALAIAGWNKDSPNIENKYAIVKRDIKMLSGLHDTTTENNWLRGKINSNAKKTFPPYEAKVYIIGPGILGEAEVWKELKKLLQWAKESTRKGKGFDSILRAISTGKNAVGDCETGIDSLGYAPYVEAVADFLTHEDTRPPLTMSIEGEWGSGKSSFILQLQKEIKRLYKEDESKGKCFIVEFEPWRHDKDDALWAAFALKFIKDTVKSMTGQEKWEANWKLWKERFQWKEAWPDLLHVGLITLIWILATIAIAIGLWKGIKLGANGTMVLPKIIGSFIAVAVSAFGAVGKVKDFLGNPLAVDLKKYMKKPDYVSKISFIDKFHKDFEKIVQSYVGNNRVYVFVDDLDRCEVPKAAELMESINLMLSESRNLVFIMGMDREKVAAGLAVKHEKLLPYLSSEVVSEKNYSEVKRLRGIRYGYAFIEKFIQVPFRLPIPSANDIKNMLLAMVGKTEEDVEVQPVKEETINIEIPSESVEEREEEPSEIKPKAKVPIEVRKEEERAERQEARQEVMLKFEGDDKNFRTIALMVSDAFGNNPRRVKQFVNLFRLRITTAASTGLITADGLLTFEQLGKFIGIGLRWPLFIRALEQKHGLLSELVEFAESDRELKDADANIKEWAENAKLIGLIKSGCFYDNGKKKTGGEYEQFSMKGVDVEKLMKVAPRVEEPIEVEVDDSSEQ